MATKENKAVQKKKRSAQDVLTEFRRREILDALQEAAAEDGFQRVTVERVAEKAGVAKGTIYTYFKDKEEMISVLVEEVTGQLMDSLEEAVDFEGTTRERLVALGRRIYEIGLQQRDLVIYLHQPNDLGRSMHLCEHESDKAMSSRIIGLGKRVLEEGIAAGELNDIDTELTSYLILNSMHHLLLAHFVDVWSHIDKNPEHMVDIYLNGIEKR